MPKRSLRRLTTLAALLLAACGGDSTGPVTVFSISIPQQPEATTLGTSVSFPVEVKPTGFSGALALNVTGAPASWSARVIPSSMDIFVGDTTTQKATVTISIPTNGDAAPSGQQIAVTATATNAEHEASALVTVANEYILRIASDAGATGAHWSAALGGVLALRSGAKLTIRNDSPIEHQIHTNNTIPGFPSQTTPMAAGTSLSYTVGAGQDAIYCSLHGESTGVLTVKVQ